VRPGAVKRAASIFGADRAKEEGMTTLTANGTTHEASRAARDTVLVVSAPERSAILVTGKDRTSWLEGLLTCELAKREQGQGAYGLLVEKKGRIQTDLFVIPSADDQALALAIPAALQEAVLATLDHYLIMEDAELTTPELAFFVAHGPRAAELRGLAPFAGTIDLLGHGGLVLAAPRDEAAALEARLATEVAKLGGVMADEATWDAVRIEHGLPRFGVEFDATLYPQEASLEKLAVSFNKGCYLGQEVVYMLENRGHVKRKLVPLDLDGGSPPAPGTAVTTPEGEAAGEIKSATLGPMSGKPVAIAMVKWAHSKSGTDLRVAEQTARVR
jgi:tRNA-modifying protein YgfZ